MKRYLLLATMLVLAAGGVMAQAPVIDSTKAPAPQTDTIADDDAENVIGGSTQRSKHFGEANVLGMPVYYDTLGRVVGETGGEGFYRRPAHHYLNSLDNRYCSFFAELETKWGYADVGIGFNFGYLPRRWGCYTSVLLGVNHDWITLGPMVRLSGSHNAVDWQLYSGLVFDGSHVGGEAGVRMAVPRTHFDFCFTSFSMGAAVINGDVFVTAGCSLDLLGMMVLCPIILW